MTCTRTRICTPFSTLRLALVVTLTLIVALTLPLILVPFVVYCRPIDTIPSPNQPLQATPSLVPPNCLSCTSCYANKPNPHYSITRLHANPNPNPYSNPNPNPNPNSNNCINCSIPVLTLTVKHDFVTLLLTLILTLPLRWSNGVQTKGTAPTTVPFMLSMGFVLYSWLVARSGAAG